MLGTQIRACRLWFAQDSQWLQGEPSLFVVHWCTQFADKSIISWASETVESINNLVCIKEFEILNSRTTASLLDALIAFIQQIELSSVAEINADCLSLLKDCVSNVPIFKNLYLSLLKFATAYGEKLDDSVIADKKKMRRDFGVNACSIWLTCRKSIFVC